METSPEFRRDAAEVLLAVRSAFAKVVEGLPVRIARPVDLAEALGLHRKLGWQIWKIIESPNPYAAARYLPGENGVRSFLVAAGRRGAAEGAVREAGEAAARIERLMDVHAGDRASLDIMLGSLAGSGARRVEEVHRRDAFRGNSYIWGIQARTRLFASIVSAGAGDRLDIAVLDGLIDLRRMRPDAPCVLSEAWVRDAASPPSEPIVIEPLWRAQGGGGEGAFLHLPPVIPEFCSTPLPVMRPVVSERGYVRVELLEGPVGDTGAITCITGQVFRGVGSRVFRPDDPTFDSGARVNKPSEVLVHDLFVREDLFGPIEPAARVFSELAGPVVGQASLREAEQLPMTVSVERLGRGPGAAATPDVPRYADLLGWVFERLGWEGPRFDLYRVRMRYPVVPSAMVMSFDLPDGSSAGAR